MTSLPLILVPTPSHLFCKLSLLIRQGWLNFTPVLRQLTTCQRLVGHMMAMPSEMCRLFRSSELPTNSRLDPSTRAISEYMIGVISVRNLQNVKTPTPAQSVDKGSEPARQFMSDTTHILETISSNFLPNILMKLHIPVAIFREQPGQSFAFTTRIIFSAQACTIALHGLSRSSVNVSSIHSSHQGSEWKLNRYLDVLAVLQLHDWADSQSRALTLA